MLEKREKGEKTLSFKEGILFGTNFVWMLAVYYTCVFFADKQGIALPYQICTGLYAAGAIILVALSAVANGKFVSKKTGEERTEKQKKTARILILFALPLIAVLLIDIMDLFVVEYFKQMLTVAVGKQ